MCSITIISIFIALFASGVALWQSIINREKLRFDIYNRRFDIYSKTLDFYNALLIFDSVTFKVSLTAFSKACEEADFLFKKESGIYDILTKMNSESYKITGVKEYGKDVAAADPDVFKKMYDRSTEALKYFNDNLPKLKAAMAPYLNFHKF